MPTISKTTNPTSQCEVSAKDVVVRVHIDKSGTRSFWVEKFDLSKYPLPKNLLLACVAHSGSTEEFFKLGTLGNFTKDTLPLLELANDRPLRFRFMIYEDGNPKLLAYADNIKAAEEGEGGGESLVDIEPMDLGGPIWRLEIPSITPGADKPVIAVERKLYPTPLTAARDHWFALLVIPEAMRQIARVIAENFDRISDSEVWLSQWGAYLEASGIPDLPDDSDEAAKQHWIEGVVVAFCAQPAIKIHHNFALAELSGEKK